MTLKNGETAQTMAEVCGFTSAKTCIGSGAQAIQTFGYLFEEADPLRHDAGTTAALDRLAHALDAQVTTEAGVPSILTDLGRFIAHDITATTDTVADASATELDDVAPLDRMDVTGLVANVRTGALDLDSIYGGAAVQGAFASQIRRLMRDPAHPAKMFVGTDPAEPNVPRLGPLITRDKGALASTLIATVPEGLRSLFMHDDAGDPATLNPDYALIGDTRNAADPGVAAIHVAFLRLHNAIVDAAPDHGGPTNDPEALFNWARNRVRWIYQWLIVNVYVPRICAPNAVKDVLRTKAALYHAFYRRTGGTDSDQMPMPLEFSHAAFRFGPRSRGVDGDTAHSALMRQMDQFLDLDGPSDPPPWPRASGQARDLLRLNQRLNLPTGQACLEVLAEQGIELPQLSPADIAATQSGDVAAVEGFDRHTPLWFYVLAEAETWGAPGRYGPLGSRIVADVLVGLVIYGPGTYWNQPSRTNALWHPANDVRPNGVTVDSLGALMQAADLM